MNPQKKLLICDLDGTLIDSSEGVLSSIQKACELSGIKPVLSLNKELVGPPLDEMLRIATGLSSPETLADLKKSFIKFYDAGECVKVQAFPGIDQMLSSVAARGHRLALATNKRSIPTMKILESKGWNKYFIEVETSDLVGGGKQTKTEMIRNINSKIRDCSKAVYLGDTHWDFVAAKEAGIPCLIAGWGYGGSDFQELATVVMDPIKMISVFEGF